MGNNRFEFAGLQFGSGLLQNWILNTHLLCKQSILRRETAYPPG
jgi:hypothetical protein